jgi:DNA-binding HxlR family transcriptional regulator
MTDAIQDVLELTRPKWSVKVLTTLAAGPQRFTDLQREITIRTGETLHAKSLTTTLVRLKEHDLVRHEPDATVPVYRLSTKGSELVQLLHEIDSWGQRHRAHRNH